MPVNLINLQMKAFWREIVKIHPLIAIVLLTGSVCATVITVDPIQGNYTSIQSAVYNSSTGDTIEVHSGTYKENVFVLKNLTLIGKDTGEGMPVIDANTSGSAITLYADGVTLTGFNLTNSGHCGCGNAGIRIESNNNTVVGNTAYKNRYGIYIEGARSNKIYGNNLVDNNVSAYDSGENQWYGERSGEGSLGFIEGLFGPKEMGNYFSDSGNSGQSCADSNGDGVCDLPRNITGGTNADKYPLTAEVSLSRQRS